MDSLKKHGILFDPAMDYENVRFSYQGGYRAACNLLDRGRKFTARFAMSDVMAIGAIRALYDRGLRVPEDVSVVGVDGLRIGDYTVPKLTSVSQSVSELATRSLELLRCRIEGKSGADYETIAPVVVAKESTRKI
jgi:LacI family transcriptional regulator